MASTLSIDLKSVPGARLTVSTALTVPHKKLQISSEQTRKTREDFEAASSSLIKVDLYRRSSLSSGRNSDMSPVEFKAFRGHSGVELLYHTRKTLSRSLKIKGMSSATR